MPITIGTTRGFGCIATISELGLVITKLKDSASVNANTWDPVTRSRLEFSIVPELFCPLAGFSAMADDLRLNFETLNIVVTDKNGTNYTPFKSPRRYPAGPLRLGPVRRRHRSAVEHFFLTQPADAVRGDVWFALHWREAWIAVVDASFPPGEGLSPR